MKWSTVTVGVMILGIIGVSIILLLILAAISISALTGSGLFDKTSEAKSAQEIPQRSVCPLQNNSIL